MHTLSALCSERIRLFKEWLVGRATDAANPTEADSGEEPTTAEKVPSEGTQDEAKQRNGADVARPLRFVIGFAFGSSSFRICSLWKMCFKMCFKMFPIHRVRSRRVSSSNRPPSKIRRTSELLRSDARSIIRVPKNTSASHFLQYYTKRSIRSTRSSKLTILQSNMNCSFSIESPE